MDGIRAVTYDCWGTLLKDKDWEGAMADRAGALRRFVDLDEQEAHDLLVEAWAKHDDAGSRSRPSARDGWLPTVSRRGISDDESIAQLTQEFEEASLKAGVEAVDGAGETLAALHEANIRLALVCDTGFTPGRVVRRLLDDAGLLAYLEVLCFSDEVGVPKPGNEIFAKALAEVGAGPREAIHIGDLRRTDIAGARDIGMHAARFRGVHDDKSDAPEADIVLDRHPQLLEVLGLA